MARAVVLSIHRRYAEAIVAGSKHYELRRRNLGIQENDLVLLYETAPDAVIRSAFVAGATLKRPKERFYRDHSPILGVEKQFYDDYLAQTESVFATEVRDPITFDPIKVVDLEGFAAPQGILHWKAHWPLPSPVSAVLAAIDNNTLLLGQL